MKTEVFVLLESRSDDYSGHYIIIKVFAKKKDAEKELLYRNKCNYDANISYNISSYIVH
jgi:hypothetical protein